MDLEQFQSTCTQQAERADNVVKTLDEIKPASDDVKAIVDSCKDEVPVKLGANLREAIGAYMDS